MEGGEGGGNDGWGRGKVKGGEGMMVDKLCVFVYIIENTG